MRRCRWRRITRRIWSAWAWRRWGYYQRTCRFIIRHAGFRPSVSDRLVLRSRWRNDNRLLGTLLEVLRNHQRSWEFLFQRSLRSLDVLRVVLVVLRQCPMNDRPPGVFQTGRNARRTPSAHLPGGFQEVPDSGFRAVGRRTLPVAPRKGFPVSDLLGQQEFFGRQVGHGLRVSTSRRSSARFGQGTAPEVRRYARTRTAGHLPTREARSLKAQG